MKRLISGILCTALVATCLCGCGKEKDSKETLYLLKEFIQKNEDGEVLRRETYDYNSKGLVTSRTIDQPGGETWWDDADGVYVYVVGPCDGVIDREDHFTYDRKGSLTKIEGDSYYDNNTYKYSYDQEGKVTGYEVYYLDNKEPSGSYELEYKSKAIELWYSGPSGEKLARSWETSKDRTEKIEWSDPEGDLQCTFEYDKNGNMTEFTWMRSELLKATGTRTYDSKGRVTSEEGALLNGDYTYEYDGDRLVSINGEKLKYREKGEDKVVVTCLDYQLTYEVVELTEEEAALARYRWNQLCRGYGMYHSYSMAMNGVNYPVFEANTVLLLPKSFE